MQLLQVWLHLFHPRRSNNHRPRLLHVESYLFFIVIAISFFTVLKVSAPWFEDRWGFVLGYASSITASQVLEQTNQQRAAAGLGPLTINSALNQAAAAKAQHMFSNQYWSHEAPDGTQPWQFIKNAGYPYRVAGENLARDFSDTSTMVEAWMASPTHRANIVNAKYQDIGIAVVDGDLLGYETTLVVQMFGSQSSANADLPTKAKIAEAESVKGVTQAETPEQILVSQPETPTTQTELLQPVVEQPQAAESQPAPIQETILNFHPPLFTPLQLAKAFFLAMILLITTTLVYDLVISQNRQTVRLVGKNLAHIMLFLSVAYLTLFFKGGIIR